MKQKVFQFGQLNEKQQAVQSEGVLLETPDAIVSDRYTLNDLLDQLQQTVAQQRSLMQMI